MCVCVCVCVCVCTYVCVCVCVCTYVRVYVHRKMTLVTLGLRPNCESNPNCITSVDAGASLGASLALQCVC